MLLDRPRTFAGLLSGANTIAVDVPADGVYYVSVSLSDVPTSSVFVQVLLGVVVVYTSEALSATQGHLEFKFPLKCVQGNQIAVEVGSMAPIDNELNNVKTTITIGAGL